MRLGRSQTILEVEDIKKIEDSKREKYKKEK